MFGRSPRMHFGKRPSDLVRPLLSPILEAALVLSTSSRIGLCCYQISVGAQEMPINGFVHSIVVGRRDTYVGLLDSSGRSMGLHQNVNKAHTAKTCLTSSRVLIRLMWLNTNTTTCVNSMVRSRLIEGWYNCVDTTIRLKAVRGVSPSLRLLTGK